MWKKSICIGLSCILCFWLVEPVLAASTKSSLSAKQQEKQQTESNIDSLNDQISNLETQKEALTNQLDELGNELLDILTSISICQDEINQKEKEVKQAKIDLEAAENAEAEQYAAMKTRMRFMYEQGDDAYLQVCLESKSISEMVNKADYVEKVYDYDRELLTQYQNTKQEVADLKQSLEEEEAELLACDYELEQEQAQLQRTIDEKKSTVSNFEAELSNAQAQVSSYKKKLNQQTSEIKALEAKQKEEEAAKAAAAAAKTSGSSTDNGTKTDSSTSTSGSETSTPTVSTSGSASGQAIANYACQFVGNPYVFGGNSLTNGTDCSGFTQAVYAHFGITIPRDSTSQRSVGTAVSYAQAQPGDIVCYAGHVAIYIGNGSIVHASTEKTGIKYGTATYRTILSIRRIVS